MARSNADYKTALNLKIKAGLIANFCLLALAITVVSLTWLLDIYYMQEPCAKIVHKEVHFIFGIVVCMFLNSIAFYLEGKQIITTDPCSLIWTLLFLFAIFTPVYIWRGFLFSLSFYQGVKYFLIGIIFCILFCKFLKIIDSFILR